MFRPVLVTIWLVGLAVSAAAGEAKLVYYTSSVDDSQQAYGIYIPSGGRPAEGYPVVLHAHGYGWSVSSGFSQWQQDWADAHGWLIVQLNARGPNFYWGIGDVATREVIDDIRLHYHADMQRIYITGGSMGGTGAFRQGVVHPDYIAASVGVDGWTDFREWHYHWYARKDQHDDIEEFRRPLLEASSPVYIAERSRWGDVHVIADGKDTVVLPWQGVDLAKRLAELRKLHPGAYDAGITQHPTKGHGGGYDVPWIYNYFLGKSLCPNESGFVIATTVLQHGEMHWGRMERLHSQGEKALLDCSVSTGDGLAIQRAFAGSRVVVPTKGSAGADAASATTESGDEPAVIDVTTTNLDAFTLQLPFSPLADAQRIAVFTDGIPCYLGMSRELTFEACRDTEDNLVSWQWVPSVQSAIAAGDGPARLPHHGRGGLRKSREIGGPLGHAFVNPFKVCYGTQGSEETTALHRGEAEAFCKGWNAFMVHGPGLEAVPEEDVGEWDIQRENLVIYGTLESSLLLRQAHLTRPMPLEVHDDCIIVRDRLTGDRFYRGKKFGVFAVYPNPLTHGRTYLVACKGRFATEPGGKALQGLEFDLEKLYWGYSDYVVLNTDQGDLPHVKNVNNKPPVTCYEAGYFVEAGYYDADWQPDRFVTLDRVRRTRPENVRLIHVASVVEATTSDGVPVFDKVDGEPKDPARAKLARPILCAMAKILDSAGKPVRQARVTGEWLGVRADSLSRPTLSNGIAYFPYPEASWTEPLPQFRVTNVMATGAAYDFEADCMKGSLWQATDLPVAVKAIPLRKRLDPQSPAVMSFELANLSVREEFFEAMFLPPGGSVTTGPSPRLVQPGAAQRVEFRWHPDPGSPSGASVAHVQVLAGHGTLARPVLIDMAPTRSLPVHMTALEGAGVARDETYEIKATLRNLGEDEATVALGCTILGVRMHLPVQSVSIAPGAGAVVAWQRAETDEPLPSGDYQARVTVLNATGISSLVTFTVW